MAGIGFQRRRQATQVPLVFAFAGKTTGLEQLVDIGDRGRASLGVPDTLDGGPQRRVAVVVERFTRAGHLGQQRQDHLHVGVDIDDHGERVEADRVLPLVGKLDELAVQQFAQVPVGTTDVNDPNLCTGAEVAIRHFIDEHRLAGARKRRDGKVEISARVVKQVEADDLAAPPEQRHHRRLRTLPLGDQRRCHHRVVGGLGIDPAELTQVVL